VAAHYDGRHAAGEHRWQQQQQQQQPPLIGAGSFYLRTNGDRSDCSQRRSVGRSVDTPRLPSGQPATDDRRQGLPVPELLRAGR